MSLLAWLAAASLMLLTGCASGLKSAAATAAAEAPARAVPAVKEESLAWLEDPANRQRLVALQDSPEMKELVRSTARSAVEGALSAPALDPSELGRAVRQAAAEATVASLRAAAAETQSTLTPAVRTSLVDVLTAPDTREAIATTASDATRASLGSSVDLVREMQQSEAEGPLAKLRRWMTLALVAAFGLGFVTAALLAWTVSVHLRAKRTREMARSLLARSEEAARGRA